MAKTYTALALILAAALLVGSFQYGMVKGKDSGYDEGYKSGVDVTGANFRREFTLTYEKGYLDCMNLSTSYIKAELPKLMIQCNCSEECRSGVGFAEKLK